MPKKYLGVVGFIIAGVLTMCGHGQPAQAAGCPELRVVFARGSGGERWHDQNYLAWKEGIESKLKLTDINYEFIDLDYPAVGIGVDKLDVTLGALVGAGDSYEFGASVDAGVKALAQMVNSGTCNDTKYVLGGYSQGAMVVSKALHSLNSERVIYAATFGDPKIYLPEGKSILSLKLLPSSRKNILRTGTVPAACRGEGLSEYRAYVPDCYAYEGLLGSYQPYQPEGFSGKLGTWCNSADIFCSSRLDAISHISYVADNLYEDASKLIFSKITAALGVENNYTSEHDTAILIDSTGSMSSMINKYKQEALRLAEETLKAGGRVALYDYRDAAEKYEPVEHCNFQTCTLESFKSGLDEIRADKGGDTDESLLAASLTVMRKLDWRLGSTKSLVILTDAGYHDPDLDDNKTTFQDVVKLSKQIDPVNFYIITEERLADYYAELASATDGKVATIGSELSLLTNEIMARFDSLPRVVEEDDLAELPALMITGTEVSGGVATVQFATDGVSAVLMAINDAVVGVLDIGAVESGEVKIADLDLTRENVVTLVPLSDSRRGESASVTLDTVKIKAPNTGRQ